MDHEDDTRGSDDRLELGRTTSHTTIFRFLRTDHDDYDGRITPPGNYENSHFSEAYVPITWDRKA